MIGKIFVTSTGYDPDAGKHVKDPYLGATPTLGACRPDIRRKIQKGDHIFVVSGKIPNIPQYVIGGFEVKEKIHAREAYERFPELRLGLTEAGEVTGNVICDGNGDPHELDHHSKFHDRLDNYIVGTNPIVYETPLQVFEARNQTLEFLKQLFDVPGTSIRDVMGRHRNMNEAQVKKIRDWFDRVRQGEPSLT